MKKIEPLFNLIYLLFVISAGTYMVLISQSTDLTFYYGMMSLTLGIGDSFHLIPRILSIQNTQKDYTKSLGTGKMITSITMTIFYLFLWEIGKQMYNIKIDSIYQWIFYGLTFLRILLCLLPQNQWQKNLKYHKIGIIRNIPFILLGFMVMILYFFGRNTGYFQYEYLWILILLSFIFYIPVILWSHKYPVVGMLMLPKSVMYIVIVFLGLQ